MSPNNATKVRIRMYRQGLGDCFLLTFFTGPEPVHVLIDCGTLGATTTGVKIREVVAQIAEDTGRHIHLLVVTHEHKDHVSGFSSGRELFEEFQVDRVWVAWTEDPNDELARQVSKFKEDLLSSLQLASEALRLNQASLDDERQALRSMALGVRELLGFYGDVPAGDTLLGADFAKTVQEAMSYASMLAGKLPDFLSPGRVIEPEWLPHVRFYVLGPPRSKEDLIILGDHDSPELYGVTERLSADFGRNISFTTSEQPIAVYLNQLGESDPTARQAFEAGLPFDLCYRLESDDAALTSHFQAYSDPDQAWRRIDYDWLTAADGLALQLDNATNNTSLVLAIELMDDGRVLLFPADAQLGNWKSWERVEFNVTEGCTTRKVQAEDLLKRTVFYKVGHHASHNATMKEKGLEAMQREDLVALIPVDRQVALNKRPHKWEMPAEALYTRLLQKTHGRVLRSDIGWPGDDDRPADVTDAEWQAVRSSENVTIEPLYIEYRLH